ncbi:MAG: helix-turn-helix transcriptional regulator [Firmicutes bacterium]|nr:helix-turn-helix transcriptional regulator [Bacillota bacterium]MBQ4092430.1 helix-turn-helix transcriptional regulator [Bacillota bacterium]
MDELKQIVANNLIRLRQRQGLTQAELGEKLNYSDKTVSKWERGESLPDAFVLKQIGEIFDVSVDSLLSATKDEELVPKKTERAYRSNMIILVSILGLWTLALLVFEVLWLTDIVFPFIFVMAIPVSLVLLLVFRSIWNQGKHNFWIVSALVFSVFIMVYYIFWQQHPWQIWLLLIPAELIVYFSFRIKRR